MAKKIVTEEIDEQFLLASLKQEPIKSTSEKDSQVSDEPVQDVHIVKRKRNKQDYEVFLMSSPLVGRMEKTTYVRKEFHDRIIKIIQTMTDNKLSVFNYIDNVLAHHFESYKDEIIEMYNRKNKGLF